MEKIKAYAKEHYIPIVREQTSQRLVEECRNLQPSRILEIGTAIGYSGILMLSSCNGNLITIEKDADKAKLAKENFERFGLEKRVEIRVNDAIIELEKIQNSGEKFDFIFLDGPKGQYKNYYPILKNCLSDNGTLFVDNVSLLGLVDNPEKITHKNRSMTNNMKTFLNMIENDSDIKYQIYHIDDGFCIINKNIAS